MSDYEIRQLLKAAIEGAVVLAVFAAFRGVFELVKWLSATKNKEKP